MMVLALYRTTDGEITPLILIEVEFMPSPNHQIYFLCLAEAQWPPRLSGNNVRSSCTLFAVTYYSGQRLHLISEQGEHICDENCPWPNDDSDRDYESPNTYKYLGDRSRVCRFLQRVAHDDSFDPKFTTDWENAVHISGSDEEPSSRRQIEQPWALDYHEGIQKTREYLKWGFILQEGVVVDYIRALRNKYPLIRYRRPERSTEDAVPGDDSNDRAAEMDDISPTASRI